MSNYTPLTNFGAKDTLPSGNAAKVVRGSEFTIEFNNIASSIATKAEVNAPSFTSNATFGGNIIVSGTVDGRDVAADGTKLDAIEANADVTDTVNVTAAGAAMLTGASFTGNVSTTGTLATGGFTLPATDGTAGQALLTDGSGAVAWSDVTVDITGKADLTGAAFTGDISLDTDAVFLSDTNDFGGKGRIGIGTNNPITTLDMVANNGASVRFNSHEGKPNVISFKDTTNNETPVKITGTHNDQHYGTNKTGGILTLTAQIDSGIQVTDINNFELRPSYTFSTKPVHVFADTPPNVSAAGQNSSSHGNFIASNVSSNLRAGFAAVLQKVLPQGGIPEYFDGLIATGLVEGTNGYVKKGSIRADGEGAIALYAAHQDKGVRYQDSIFEPCAATTVPDGQSGTITRYLQGGQSTTDLGRPANRWRYIYLANNPNVSSDQRLKQNIEDADDAGSTIDAIQVRKFDWIEGGKHQSYGMIAQELAEVCPEVVSVPENEEDTLGIATGDLIPMLIKEVQSLRSRVAELENV